ncbi:MAG: thiamine phosphate synthase [Gammaproteobacteria bacterium]|nr:thiamine phosphate synthase [Gammaproteobacteria bacterium]
MRPARLARGLYAITPCDTMDFSQVLAKTQKILHAGISALQYRDKHSDPAARPVRAEALGNLCRAASTPFIVNDDPALAAGAGATGVHLGADDPSPAMARQWLGDNGIIGVSCYDDVELAARLAHGGADYIAFGAFFPTRTKTPRASLDTLRAARTRLSVPMVAIGGITPDNCAPLLDAGADLLAVVSSVYDHPDPAGQVQRFQSVFRRYGEFPE